MLPTHIDARFNFNFDWKIDRDRADKDDLIFTSFLRGSLIVTVNENYTRHADILKATRVMRKLYGQRGLI